MAAALEKQKDPSSLGSIRLRIYEYELGVKTKTVHWKYTVVVVHIFMMDI